MSIRSLQLARRFLQVSTCRNVNPVRPQAHITFSDRRWFSERVPSATSTESSVVSADSTNSSAGEKTLDPSPISPPTDNPNPSPEPVISPPKKKRTVKPKPSLAAGEEAPPKKKRTVKPKTPLAPGEEAPPKRTLAPRVTDPNAKNSPKKTGPKKRSPPANLHTSTLELPPIDDWRYYFPPTRDSGHRAVTRKLETAKLLAAAFIPPGSKDKIVIEANPGPGQLTRALLALPKKRIKKLIVIEDIPNYLPFLQSLAAVDPRVVVVPLAAKYWGTYDTMQNTGVMDGIESFAWDKVNPQLHFIMHASGDTQGEQLVTQLLRAVPDKQWLFKYGRVPMSLVVPDRLWARIKAPASTHQRCKVSAMSQATVDFEEALPFEATQPFSEHFHPRNIGLSESELNRFRAPHRAINVIPLAESLIKPGDLDFWDFCLRKLFVLKSRPLSEGINGLGPGGYNLLPKLDNPSLPEDQRLSADRTPRSLSIHEWAILVSVFKDWPFRPEELSIDAFSSSALDRN